jgi:hypothetical protein
VLPTFENTQTLYLNLGFSVDRFAEWLPHLKEQMLFMIINMLRGFPDLFVQYLKVLASRLKQRY